MGCAEIIALSKVRANKQWEVLRHQLHERFDEWLETLEQQWPEPPSTLPEVTATVWHIAPCGRAYRGQYRCPSRQPTFRRKCLNLNQKKCKFLYAEHTPAAHRKHHGDHRGAWPPE